MRANTLISTIFLLFAGQLFGQNPDGKIRVYLLGTFHFAQTDSLYDVLTVKNQRSISELCEIIKKQQPDKIFIERMPDYEYMNRMDSLYQAFRNGDTLVRRNEIWQVAFRVARDLNHETIYSCDHPGQYGNIYGILEDYAGKHNQTDILNYKGKGITRPVTDLLDEDLLMKKSDLLDYIRWMNSDEVQKSSHAHYINLYPQIGNTDVYNYDSNYMLGASLTVDWYRRNILIYTKMINQLDYSEKAIFLIMGNDHIPIIRNLFESNPFFEVIGIKEWLGDTSIETKFRKRF